MLYFLSLLGLVVLGSVYINTDSGQADIIRRRRGEDLLKFINNSVDPCDDFYDYACGNWPHYYPIPSDDVDTDEMSVVTEKLMEQVLTLLQEPTRDDDWPTDKMVKDYFASCMNLELRRERGLTPLLDFVKSLGGWPVLDPTWSAADFSWIKLVKRLKKEHGFSTLLEITVDENIRNNSQHIIYIIERRTHLPNKDYYYDSSKSYHLLAYKEFFRNSLAAFGVTGEKAEMAVEEIVAFEAGLARGTADKNHRLDLDEMFMPMTLEQLQETHSAVNWTDFIEKSLEVPVTDDTDLVVGSAYISNLFDVIEATNHRVVANYIIWEIVQALMQNTDDRFDAIVHKYYESIAGEHTIEERWKQCLSSTKGIFPFAIGSQYVRKHFNEEKQNDVRNMSEAITDAFRGSVELFSWIDGKSKDGLKRKLEKLKFVIGYPELVLDQEKLNKEYGGLRIDREKYFENDLNYLIFSKEQARKKLSEETDKAARFDAVKANAYNAPTRNQVYVTAGFLQYPYYSRHFPRSLNFAQMGTILGHELVHGFDDRGQKFDADGNMVNWWTAGTIDNFMERAKCFVNQYNNYTFLGQKLRGEPSLGENIADNGGLRYAYIAYQRWVADQDEATLEQEVLHGVDFNRNQLFFLGYAQMWCMAYKVEAMRNRINVDNHTPHKYRIIGTLSNFEEFSREFKCPFGSPMNPEKKCKLW